jgi:LysR family transcriptional regulator, cyn operon transcriptional activator
MDRFPTSITLRQIQYFLAAAESLHFTKAAERLSVTQPTLSHQIAQLETSLGGPLFDRIGKQVRLTESGTLLQRYASRAVRELEAGRLALSELEGMVRGELRIGVIQSFSRTLLPSILGGFITKYPGIHLDIREMTGLEIEQGLAAGSLDLGIAFAPTALDGTEVEPVLDERLLLVVGPDNEFAKRRSVRLSELNKKAVVLLNKSYLTRRLIDKYLEQAGAKPNVVCETNSMEIMLGAVAQSRIVTIAPEYGLRHEGGRYRAIPLREPTPVRTSALLWPRLGFRSISARTFGQMMRDRFLTSDRT